MPETNMMRKHEHARRIYKEIEPTLPRISDKDEWRKAFTLYEIVRFYAANIMEEANAEIAAELLECVAMEVRRARRARVGEADFDRELFDDTRNDEVVQEIVGGYPFYS